MLKPSDSDQCAKYLKVVADPDRLLIIQCLQTGASKRLGHCDGVG